MTLRGKLIAIQLPFFLALAFLTIVAVSALNSLGGKSQEILKDNYRSVLAAQRMDEAVERLDDAALSFILGAKAQETEVLARRQIELFEAELKVEEGNITEPGEAQLAAALRRDWGAAREAFARLLASVENGGRLARYSDEVKPAVVKVRIGTAEILGLNQDAMIRRGERALAYSRQLQWVLLSGWLAATLCALYVVWRMTRRFVQPIYSLQQAVRRIGEGDLEVRAELVGKDEVTMLAGDVNSMAESLQRYRKSSLGELLQAQLAAQASIDSLPEPVLIFNAEKTLLNMNLRAEELMGPIRSLEELDPEAGAAIRQILDHVLEGRGAVVPSGFDAAVKVSSPAGDHYLLPMANPLRDEDGITSGVTMAFQDVTRFKRFDELKNDLVSTVAHEFRTPLTSIRMAIHICLEELAGPLTPKQADMLSAAREECERLQTLVDDLLDLSRLQKGPAPMSPESTRVSTLLAQALARRRDDAAAREITLRQVMEGPDGHVLVDQALVSTVFDNLIANALRYTPQGGEVVIKAYPTDDTFRFEVADSGPGIPRHLHERVFDRLYQIPGANSGAKGLGLSIVREIVLSHGGEVGLESSPGSGSVFWFTLNRASEEKIF